MSTKSNFFFGGGGDGGVPQIPFYSKEIAQSLRFDYNAPHYLRRTPAAGNRKTGTFSVWAKRGNLSAGTSQYLISARDSGLASTNIFWSTLDKIYIQNSIAGVQETSIGTSAQFRDTSAWYHICVAWDTTQATEADRVSIYVNGVKQTDLDASNYPSLNEDFWFNTALGESWSIGSIPALTKSLDGYLAEMHFVDGTAYDATAFGEFKNGVWIPKTVSVSYGTNGFHLEFNGNTNDSAGTNNWTANNISAYDYMLDTPTNNYATFNPIHDQMLGTDTLSQGNLFYTNTDSSISSIAASTFAASTGSYYYEILFKTGDALNTYLVALLSTNSAPYVFSGMNELGTKTGGVTGTSTTYIVGDLLGLAVDFDAGTIGVYKNGTLATTLTYSPMDCVPCIADNGTGSSGMQAVVNFGQDSTFAGNKLTGSANATDNNGQGDFYYTPPTGYLALCSHNLPEPVIGPTAGQVQEFNYYDPLIETAMKFDSAKENYLSRTPSTAGNQKTWTWSGWVKRGQISTSQYLLSNLDSSALNGFGASFDTDDRLNIFDYNTAYSWHLQTTQAFSDTSAWYHFTISFDTTQANSNDRVKLWVDGVEITSFLTSNYPATQNADGYINNTNPHAIGRAGSYNGVYFDGYLADVYFVDGQALQPTDFGRWSYLRWVPKTYTGTYGTNGFHLDFKHDGAEGFGAIAYQGTTNFQYVGGLGFSPDLVWLKNVDIAGGHGLYDTVRGAGQRLDSQSTGIETTTVGLNSFEADGFTVSGTAFNGDKYKEIAWCWDAGTGSPVSNTNGTITSTVKASTTYGFSIVSYTGNGLNDQTVGHGLTQAPDLVIWRNRDLIQGWVVYHSAVGADRLLLDTNSAAAGPHVHFGIPTASTILLGVGGSSLATNASADRIISYCWHSVAGYSDFGTYLGDGTSNGSKSITLGFKPGFVIIKKATLGTGDWMMLDLTRSPSGNINELLRANLTNVEVSNPYIVATATGFTIWSTAVNADLSDYIYLAFADTRDQAFWRDVSGTDNHWRSQSLLEQDRFDSPTNDYATLDTTQSFNANVTFSEGNLSQSCATTTNDYSAGITPMASGKWYWEVLYTSGSDNSNFIGITRSDFGTGGNLLNRNGALNNLTGTSTGFSNNNVLGLAFDADIGDLTIYESGVSKGTFSISNGFSGSYVPLQGNQIHSLSMNFGQDSSFAGRKVSQFNTDQNGEGDFYYAPPTGYLALNSNNLGNDIAAVPSVSTADANFNTVLWTGDDTAPRSITGVGFQPDLLWTKARSANTGGVAGHWWMDAVRGSGTAGLKLLDSSSTGAESTGDSAGNYGLITSLDADGFTIDQGALTADNRNQLNETYVAWNWKANNTAGSSNTNGTITSTVAANTTAGFSIVSYTGTGVAGTIGHGLSQPPEIVVIKNRTTGGAGYDWTVYTTIIDGSLDYLFLNLTSAKADSGLGVPTSSVVNLGNGVGTNESSSAHIAYCFHSVEGYSKIGTYTGNASADGPFVYLGFRPAWVMIKNITSAYGWEILDDKRSDYNLADDMLFAESSSTELTTPAYFHSDFTSNGFKLRTSDIVSNGSSNTYIYMAFAENPFKYANAR